MVDSSSGNSKWEGLFIMMWFSVDLSLVIRQTSKAPDTTTSHQIMNVKLLGSYQFLVNRHFIHALWIYN